MTITYATIGTNWITTSWIHAASHSHWKLHAIYSRTAATAEAFAHKHTTASSPTPKTYTSLDGLAADSALQAVYIASPNSLHHAQTRQFLLAGKHVILEKPAVAQPEQWTELVQLAEEKGVMLIEAYRHIQEANYKLIRRLVIDEQLLGRIFGASVAYTSRSSRFDALQRGEVTNVFSRDFEGGALVDVGVYPVAFAVGLFGTPTHQSYVPIIHPASGTDVAGVGILQFQHGDSTFGVQVNVSKAYKTAAPVEIHGERGTLTINGITDIRSVVFLDAATKEARELAGSWKEATKPDENMLEEAEEFARIILEHDRAALRKLHAISLGVLHATSAMRRQAGITYPVDS